MPIDPLLAGRGERVLVLGNEAIARGALEAGLCFAASYPGTPASEVLESLARVADELGVYVEWSVNEKAAFEAAYGAAIAGVRSMASMKHVGLNVAADALMSSAYSGVREGFVVVSADDPGQHSSQNEQDNRWYGLLAHVPVLEPSSPRDAYGLTKLAFDLSSSHELPVILRSVTRVSHTLQPVLLEGDARVARKCRGEFVNDPERWVLVPSHARRRKAKLVEAWERLTKSTDERLVDVVNPGKEVAVVSSGIAFSYVEEALEILGVAEKVTLVKPNLVVPLPEPRILEALANASSVLVVEETDPVLEIQLKDLLAKAGLGNVRVVGKGPVPHLGELSLEIVYGVLSKFLDVGRPPPWVGAGEAHKSLQLPPRPPVLCPGCPHRNTFYVLKVAANKAGLKNVVYSGDIGCYSLGYQRPFGTQSVVLEMGGGVGAAHGLSKVVDSPVLAVFGDSTFYHATLPGLVNAVYNGGKILPVVLDNSTTAMTGHQPHPGVGVTATGRPTASVRAEELLTAMGYRTIVVNPMEVKKAIEAVAEALRSFAKGERVAIVSRMRCSLEVAREARRRGVVLPTYKVLEDKCTNCMACVNLLACPAIIVEDGKKPYISQDLCLGCGLCAQVCPYNAIVVSREGSGNWRELWGA
ncbi:MAG: indolepyruvate ferredoxin oxidoreductase subunit alpha [Desulfurococcaceae archaeon]